MEYIIFGLFISEKWGAPDCMYKLTQNELLIDRSGSYWEARFTKNGYEFSGEKLPQSEFLKTKDLFDVVPVEVFKELLPSPNRPGNRDERTTYIEIKKGAQIREFIIDQYDGRDDTINEAIKTFRKYIEEKIKEIKT